MVVLFFFLIVLTWIFIHCVYVDAITNTEMLQDCTPALKHFISAENYFNDMLPFLLQSTKQHIPLCTQINWFEDFLLLSLAPLRLSVVFAGYSRMTGLLFGWVVITIYSGWVIYDSCVTNTRDWGCGTDIPCRHVLNCWRLFLRVQVMLPAACTWTETSFQTF